ncbi:hypothetical protein J4G63_12105 [Aeromonas sobria]|uniref:Uncharacterized protein n=1 Tax=Aeromonas sobria TaxID=646 RepID=A0A1S2D3D3_AERSO|nr:hypothetical protein [Aeromonas sobria]MBS4687980.1 hypothetical protein [Aeromonas sobria]OHY94411.1 hypothetical protein BJD16_10715 [Aeromonas sobria]
MEQARKWCAWMLGVPLWAAQAGADELWLVELEHSDGIRLQFQGAEVEQGSAAVWRQGVVWDQPLKPGDRLALLVADGVATRIELLAARSPLANQPWQRAQDRLQSFDDRQLTLATLGTVPLNAEVRWVNGSAADLHVGSELVLIRSADGILQGIEVINPEE